LTAAETGLFASLVVSTFDNDNPTIVLSIPDRSCKVGEKLMVLLNLKLIVVQWLCLIAFKCC
jgi:hypothetical protein